MNKVLAWLFGMLICAQAGAWAPDRPIHVIIAYKAGSGTDLGARLLVSKAQQYLGQPLVITNIPGNGGRDGWEQFLESPADGQTLAFINIPTLTTFALQPDAPFDLDDFVPVCNHLLETEAVVVSSSGPYRSLRDMVSIAKMRKSFKCATNGFQASNHTAAQLLAQSAGFNYQAVSRDNTKDQINALLHKEVDFICVKVSDIKQLLEEPRPQLRVLATFSRQRLKDMNDVPTLRELGYYPKWYGGARALVLPHGVTAEMVSFYEQAFKAMFDDPEIIEAHRQIGLNIDYMDHAELAKFIKDDEEFYRTVVKDLY